METRSGTCPLPLYHGTSSVNLQSIREEGLGGRDFVRELDLVRFIGVVLGLADEFVPENEDGWPILRLVVQMIARQEVTAGGFNFRHGTTYLTPAPWRALSYAQGNPEGSELLTNARKTLEFIERHAPGQVSKIANKYPSAMARLRLTGEPVVLCAKEVELSWLQSEQGGSVETVMRQIRDVSDHAQVPFGIPILLQQFNFELLRPLPVERLFVAEVHDGRVTSQEELLSYMARSSDSPEPT